MTNVDSVFEHSVIRKIFEYNQGYDGANWEYIIEIPPVTKVVATILFELINFKSEEPYGKDDQ